HGPGGGHCLCSRWRAGTSDGVRHRPGRSRRDLPAGGLVAGGLGRGVGAGRGAAGQVHGTPPAASGTSHLTGAAPLGGTIGPVAWPVGSPDRAVRPVPVPAGPRGVTGVDLSRLRSPRAGPGQRSGPAPVPAPAPGTCPGPERPPAAPPAPGPPGRLGRG